MTPQSEMTEPAVSEGKQTNQYTAAAARPTFIMAIIREGTRWSGSGGTTTEVNDAARR